MTLLSLLLLLSCTGTDHDDHDGDDHDEHVEEEEGHSGAQEVHLSEQGLAHARLVIAPAVEDTLAQELVLPARVALDPSREAQVSAWIPGQVSTISVRVGDQVRKGQTLARVQSPELGQAIAAYRVAKAQDDAADARLERLYRLKADGVASTAQIMDAEAVHAQAMGSLEAAEERLRILNVDPTKGDPHAGEHYPSHVPVRSPISGTVLAVNATIGRQVQPGQALFHVAQLDHLWLLLDLFESDLQHVQAGQTVHFETQAWPDQRFSGVVDQVGDIVDPLSRTLQLRVLVDNPQGKLKPNMFATATLELSASSTPGVVLPSAAVRHHDGQDVVFIEEHPGEYLVRPVTVTQSSSDQVIVTGVTAGEPVVVQGAFTLMSELEKGELGSGHAH